MSSVEAVGPRPKIRILAENVVYRLASGGTAPRTPPSLRLRPALRLRFSIANAVRTANAIATATAVTTLPLCLMLFQGAETLYLCEFRFNVGV